MENTFDLQRKHAEEKLSLEELVDIYNNDLFESYPLIKIGFLYWDSFENIDKREFLKQVGKEIFRPELEVGIELGKNHGSKTSSITHK